MSYFAYVQGKAKRTPKERMAESANATLSDAKRKSDFFPQKRKKPAERPPQGGGSRKLSLNEAPGFRHVGRNGKIRQRLSFYKDKKVLDPSQ